MQLPFYSEFRLPRYTHTYICMCVQTRCASLIYPPVSTRFSPSRIRNGLSTLRHLAWNPLFPRQIFYPPLFTESLPPDPTSLSPVILLPGDASESHRYTCIHCTPSYVYLLDRFTLGALFWHIHEGGETRTHGYAAAVPSANYFCLASLKTITSLQVWGRRQERRRISLVDEILSKI